MLLTLLPGVLNACRRAFPARSPRAALERLRMLATLLRRYPVWVPLAGAPQTQAAGLLYEERPEMLDVAIRPYLDATWPPARRIERIIAHCAALDRLGAPFIFSPRKAVVLADLADLRPGRALILDQPAAFRHQGNLTLSLFDGGTRTASVTFSLRCGGNDTPALLVGGMGAATGDGGDDRPSTSTDGPAADLLLACLRALARCLGASRLAAVRDHARVPDDSRAGAAPADRLDPVWFRHGGRADGPDRLALPFASGDAVGLAPQDAAGERRAILATLDARIARALATSRPVFPDRR